MSQVFVTNPSSKLDLYFGSSALDALVEVSSVRLNREDRELSITELVDLATDCEVILAYRGTPGPAELFAALPRLKAFVRCAVDIRTVDVQAASSHGILVTRTGSAFQNAVAEWVMGCAVVLCRHLHAYACAYQSSRPPSPMMGLELRGSTLGVIGYGGIGQEVCRLAEAFGMRVIVTDPYVQLGEGQTHLDLEALLQQADVVVCLAAATAETENMMNARAFAAMKPGAFFINAARGQLVDEQALLDSLQCGHLAGCAIDVGRAQDQMPSGELARHPRVLATPHVGGLTRPATDFQALQAVRQVASILAGTVPEGAVNAPSARRCGFAQRS